MDTAMNWRPVYGITPSSPPTHGPKLAVRSSSTPATLSAGEAVRENGWVEFIMASQRSDNKGWMKVILFCVMTCHIPVIFQSFPEASCWRKGKKLHRACETGSWWERNQEVVTNEQVHILIQSVQCLK